MISRTLSRREKLIEHYRVAKYWVEHSTFASELAWQKNLCGSPLTESGFLREYAWVVLNSGFRESVVRKHFDYISLAFCDWSSSEEISQNSLGCVAAAQVVFANRRKLNAIVDTAKLVCDLSFAGILDRLDQIGIAFLQELPFIGQITSWHLAKNIGLNVAKPDRHVVRIATHFGYSDVQYMCAEIEQATGDSKSVADLVLWRFAVENGVATRNFFREKAVSAH